VAGPEILPHYAFFRGRIVPYSEANVGILTHALNYGTAVFGGLRAYWNEDEQQLFVFRPLDHFKRFLQSARLMCMEIPYSAEDLVQHLTELMRKEGHRQDCYIRPLAFFANEIIGVRLHNLKTEVSIVALPFGRYGTNEDGQRVTVSSWRRVDDNIIPARGKIAGAYVNSAFVKTDANRAGFDETIVLNQDGHVSEGSAANIFLLRNGVWATPMITDNVLEGITRRTILHLMREDLKWEVAERTIDRTEVYLADEMFFSGTGAQISAITEVDFRAVGTGKLGEKTTELRQAFFDIVHGRNPKYRHWCHPIFDKRPGAAPKSQTEVSIKS
jgi:branched-chain amino acid aminotransferase